MAGHRIFSTSFGTIHRLYVAKVERKGHTAAELHQVICWLTGYDEAGIEQAIDTDVTLEEFFTAAPAYTPLADRITGVICGMRVEEIDDPLMKQVRQLDKLVDEVARGKKMTSILRT